MSRCKCNEHGHPGDGARANFLERKFIPQRWRLSYFGPLTEGAVLYLDGYCKDCYGDLEEQVAIVPCGTEDALFQKVYDLMDTAHPYAKIISVPHGAGTDKKSDYFCACDARAAFYRRRDKLTQFDRNAQFLQLFHDYDREAARLWLEKHYPLQAHTEVLRDTGGSLFCSVLRMAKENGDLAKAESILDYVLPCKLEPGSNEGVPITAYEFNFEASTIFGGSEGIYLDCSLVGKFDESGRQVLHIGTLKTLRRDLEAMKIMAELGGALIYHADEYVNQELHRYTPKKDLEAEAASKRAKEGGDA